MGNAWETPKYIASVYGSLKTEKVRQLQMQRTPLKFPYLSKGCLQEIINSCESLT
jgi:hypothetical protein